GVKSRRRLMTRVPNARIVGEGNRFARALDAAGVPEGAGVAALLPNAPEMLFAYRGAAWSGRRWTPICWHWKPDEVRYVVEDSEARAFVADARFAEAARAACASVPPRARFCVGGEIDGFRPFAAIAQHSDPPRERPLAGDTLLYPAGTRGRPRGVLRPPHAAQPPPGPTGAAGVAMLRRAAGELAGGTHLVAAPLYHSGPN